MPSISISGVNVQVLGFLLGHFRPRSHATIPHYVATKLRCQNFIDLNLIANSVNRPIFLRALNALVCSFSNYSLQICQSFHCSGTKWCINHTSSIILSLLRSTNRYTPLPATPFSMCLGVWSRILANRQWAFR